MKPFSIISDTIRFPGGLAKGYHRHAFADAFDRYFAPDTPSQTATTEQPPPNEHFSNFQSVTPDPGVTDLKSQKPPSNGHCFGVTDQKGDTPGNVHCRRSATVDLSLVDAFLDGTEVKLHQGCIQPFANLPDFLDRRRNDRPQCAHHHPEKIARAVETEEP